MAREEKIVSGYRNGGAGERLDVYLAYPELREFFDEIEREEERGSRPGRNPGRRGRIRRCVDWCFPGRTGSRRTLVRNSG